VSDDPIDPRVRWKYCGGRGEAPADFLEIHGRCLDSGLGDTVETFRVALGIWHKAHGRVHVHTTAKVRDLPSGEWARRLIDAAQAARRSGDN